jgi:hypothetical protein
MTDIDIDAIKDRAEQAEPHARGCGCVTCLSQRDVPALLDEVERLRADYRTVAAECASATSRALDYKAECDEARAAIARVEAVVDEYGDDYDPEDRWRYTRDLRAALRGDE